MKNKMQAFFFNFINSNIFFWLFFWGGLLDPLIGLWAAGIYFFVIGTYLMYRYLLTSVFRGKLHEYNV